VSGLTGEAFDDEGHLTDEAGQQKVMNVGASLARFLSRLGD